MPDSSALTPALEDYLEAIYVLQKVKDVVKVVDIAEHLKVTMASVTGGIRRLAAMDFVIYEKWRRVKLTDAGEQIARTVSRRHEDLYTFYHEILGADRDLAEKSACKVEHVLDPSIVERINFLSRWMRELPENEQKDFRKRLKAQCGAPGKTGLTLDKVKTGQKVVATKINVKGEVGQRLVDMGLTKGSEIQVVKVAPLGDPIEIKLKGYRLTLRKSEAAGIRVKA